MVDGDERMELHNNPERIAAFRRGERDLLAALYRAYLPDVERLLRLGFTFTSQGKTVRFQGFQEPFLLQDTIQEGFLRAFREEARATWDDARPWRPYLLTIVRNQVIDQFRKQTVERRYFVPLAALVGPEGSEQDTMDDLSASLVQEPSPEASAFQAQLGAVLKAFMRELGEADRALVRHHLVGEVTQQEMADRLGESRNDVRKRVREVRASLLRHLKREGLITGLDATQLLRDLSTLAGVLV